MTAFYGKVENGKMAWATTATAVAVQNWLKSHEGTRFKLEEAVDQRSDGANRYYWMYLGVIARETGDDPNSLHEFFKRKLLPPEIIRVMGEDVKVARSTAKLDKLEFQEYLDRIAALCEVPLPDPADAGYISNY